MTMILLAATLHLITVHMIDGREVAINPREVTQIRDGRADDDPKRVLVPGVHCVIFFTDGKYLSVTETCAEVRKLMEGNPQ